MTLDIDIAVEAEAWAALPDHDALVERGVAAALAAADFATPDGAELSVLLCDDAAIRALNRDWRGKDKATNVLSFPSAQSVPPGTPRLLGDIAIAYETLATEAAADHKGVAAHFLHLVVHGTLHLIGLDHETEQEAAAMEDLERAAMARLGLDDPYEGTDPVTAATP